MKPSLTCNRDDAPGMEFGRLQVFAAVVEAVFGVVAEVAEVAEHVRVAINRIA